MFFIGVPIEMKKDGKITGTTIALGIILLIIAALFAWGGSKIPTVINPWVNNILFPILQFSILVFLSRK